MEKKGDRAKMVGRAGMKRGKRGKGIKKKEVEVAD